MMNFIIQCNILREERKSTGIMTIGKGDIGHNNRPPFPFLAFLGICRGGDLLISNGPRRG
jgi:hypothetical protein